jgi:uncharacterized membrane protein
VSWNQRPLSVTVIGYLFVVTGLVGLAYHVRDLAAPNPFRFEILWVLVLRLLAIVGGVFLLRGANWARWLLIAWLAYHVVLSAWHTVFEVVVHAALLVVIAYVLLRPRAAGDAATNSPTSHDFTQS